MSGEPDAVVVGAGPNGLAAALRLASAGLRVHVVEAAPQAGGGLRSAALTQPGFVHDVCATVVPTVLASPFFREFGLARHGVRLLQPDLPYGHPLDSGPAGVARRSLDDTAAGMGADADAYRRLLAPFVAHGTDLADFFFQSALRRPPVRSAGTIARFGLQSLSDVRRLVRTRFRTEAPRALIAGAAAHGMLGLTKPLSAGFGLLLGTLAHHVGWPLVEGGSQRLADAMVLALEGRGGVVTTGHEVTDLREFDGVPAVLLDTTPRDLVRLGGDRVHEGYRRWVDRYRHAPGVFKMDWVLSDPVPWRDAALRRSPTVHVGGGIEEMVAAEAAAAAGRIPDRPFVLTVQPTVVDPTRAPRGGHVLWGYTHVPFGCDTDMTHRIEAQIERFAPGFRDTVVERVTTTPSQLAADNRNDVGGDISNGLPSLWQMLARPVPRWNTYKTPVPGTYLASAATPPGPAVHGMCGDNAARLALREVFGIRHPPRLDGT